MKITVLGTRGIPDVLGALKPIVSIFIRNWLNSSAPRCV